MASARPEPDATRIARLLDDLSRPAAAETEILRMGAGAIPGLLAYLEGPPQSIPAGKQLAVQLAAVLGGPEAHKGLRRFMASPNPSHMDPVLALSEGVARNEAASQLARMDGPDATQDFLLAYRRHHLPVAARMLGRFQVPEAVPDLIEALEGDLTVEPAFEALRQYGPAADGPLQAALRSPRRDPEGRETRPSRQRRVRLALLLGVPGRSVHGEPLRETLQEAHPALRAAAALALRHADPGACGGPCLEALLEGCLLPEPWLKTQCQAVARALGPEALEPALRILAFPSILDLYGVPVPSPRDGRIALGSLALGWLQRSEDLKRLEACLEPPELAASLTRMEAHLQPGIPAGLAVHPDPRIRRALTRVLGHREDPSEAACLFNFLADPARGVRAETRIRVGRLLREDPGLLQRTWTRFEPQAGWRVRWNLRWLRMRSGWFHR